jgi:hypothetical protein
VLFGVIEPERAGLSVFLFLAGAGAVAGQDRVAAGDQPLAGEIRRGDLREVLLIEEAELERAAGGLADRPA